MRRLSILSIVHRDDGILGDLQTIENSKAARERERCGVTKHVDNTKLIAESSGGNYGGIATISSAGLACRYRSAS